MEHRIPVPAVGRILVLACALAGTLAWSGCAEEAADGSPRLDSEAVAELAGRAPKVAFLVFRPDDCLACATDMPHWLAFRKRSPGSVVILVTRNPSSAEEKVFARYRIPVDGVLRRGALPEPARGGEAHLYVNGSLALSGSLNHPALRSTLDRELAP